MEKGQFAPACMHACMMAEEGANPAVDSVEGKWERLCDTLNKGHVGIFFCVWGFFLVVWIVLVAFFDVNRFHGYCPTRAFNDSIGPPAHDGDRTICRENKGSRPTPPGKLPGHVISCWERSLPAWIVIGVLSVVTTAANLVLILTHPKKTKEGRSNSQQEQRAYGHNISELSRIGWIRFGCTVFIVVYYTITVGMIADCRDDKGVELFYSIMLAIDVLFQGM